MFWGLVAWYKSLFQNTPIALGTLSLGLIPIIIGFQMIMSAVVMDIQQSPCGPTKLYDFTEQDLKAITTRNPAHAHLTQGLKQVNA